MTMLPDRKTFNEIKDLLLPLVEIQTERLAFVRSALVGCPVLRQIDWSGASSVFANHLIQKLIDFGQCQPGRPAIVLLLEELKLETGVEKQAQIDRLIQVYMPQPVKPAEAPDEELYYDDQYIWSEVDAEIQALDVLPQPFAWIDIPGGEVTLEEGGYVPKEGQTFDLPGFSIAKYPITNAQYAKFVEAGGYHEKRWWTEAGWEWREKDRWSEPRYWTDPKWNGAEHPVVGVSWYECVAFCNWLSEVTTQKITLPTEQQWQRAAQGDESCVYPWGPDWDASRCNNNVESKGIGKTTRVTEYEGKGDSPYGVVDMGGNVWEWCMKNYKEGVQDINSRVDRRVVRGGSWTNTYVGYFQSAYRGRNYPHNGVQHGGFRIVREYA